MRPPKAVIQNYSWSSFLNGFAWRTTSSVVISSRRAERLAVGTLRWYRSSRCVSCRDAQFFAIHFCCGRIHQYWNHHGEEYLQDKKKELLFAVQNIKEVQKIYQVDSKDCNRCTHLVSSRNSSPGKWCSTGIMRRQMFLKIIRIGSIPLSIGPTC